MERKPKIPVAEQLFRRGSVTVPLQGGDVFVSCRRVPGSRFPFRISGTDRTGTEVLGGSGLTEGSALGALPYRMRSRIENALQDTSE